jgi:hypothetical protein
LFLPCLGHPDTPNVNITTAVKITYILRVWVRETCWFVCGPILRQKFNRFLVIDILKGGMVMVSQPETLHLASLRPSLCSFD